MRAQTCLKYYSESIVNVLTIISNLDELQHSYHSLIIVRLYFIFTAQSPLNSLKCLLDIFSILACALIGFFEVTWHLTMKLFAANSAVLGLRGEMGMSKSKG